MHISLAFLDEGDEVLIPNPGYPTYSAVTKIVGAKPIYYSLKESKSWLPDINELKKVDLSKEFFIRTIATMYFIGSIPLYGSLLYHGLGTLNDLFISFFLIIPALIGQYFGTKIRHRLSNDLFRKCILITLMILGLILLFKNF